MNVKVHKILGGLKYIIILILVLSTRKTRDAQVLGVVSGWIVRSRMG